MGATERRPGRATKARRDHKLTISISPDLHAELVEMAAERGVSMAELFRRGIAVEKFLYEHPNSEVVIRDGKETTKLVFVA